MDKQKPTTKITRKMASVSQDHNNLMMYYSSISTDESGAPMRWKMTSPMKIGEEKITVSKSKPSSIKSSPVSSREPSGERRGRPSLLDSGRSQPGKRTSSRDSSESSYSRDSSTESKGKEKSLKSDKQSQGGDIVNGDKNIEQKPKGKRGRPKSLDLSAKPVTNGDDEKFKSPHPLTPCNIVVKRRKGRPKETPPTLTAEPPVTSLIISGQDGARFEDEIHEVQQRKPVSKKRLLHNAQLFKSVRNKTGISNKFLKRRKLVALNRKSVVNIETKTTDLTNNTQTGDKLENMNTSNSKESTGESVPIKRKVGRPPGAKNKPKVFFNALPAFVPKRKAGGRPPGSKNKVRLGLKKTSRSANRPRLKKEPIGTGLNLSDSSKLSNKELLNVESVSKVSDSIVAMDTSPDISNTNEKNMSSVINNDENRQEAQKTDGSETISTNSSTQTMLTEDTRENIVESISPELDQSITEAIETVLYKVKNDLPIDKPSLFSELHCPRFGGIRNISKIKKVNKHLMRKQKHVLESGLLDTENKTFALLPLNDLRRKLHSKQLNKKIEQMQISVANSMEISPVVDSVNIPGEVSVKKENSLDAKTDSLDKEASTNVLEKGLKDELNMNLVPSLKKLSTDNKEVINNSDSESVCSEVSTVSYCSTKRFTEKQIVVLGEDNIDSDDSSIRTRQRFEIVPGKKRKRTLSGEFDLVDEKQLRKEKKAKLLGVDDSLVETEVDRNISETKSSPKTKPKPRKVPKFKNGESFKLRKLQLRRESPFLTSGKKKRRKRKLKLSPSRRRNEGKNRMKTTANVSPGKAREGIDKLIDPSFFSAGEKSHTATAHVNDDSSVKSDGSMIRKGIFEQFVPWEKQTLLKEADKMSPDNEDQTVDETDTDEVVIDVLTNIVNSVVKSREQHIGSYAESWQHMNYLMPFQASSPVSSTVSSISKVQLSDIQQSTAERAIGNITKNILNKVRGRRGRKRLGPLPIARNPLLEKPNLKFGRGRKANVGAKRVSRQKLATAAKDTEKRISGKEEGIVYDSTVKPKVIRSRTARKSATPSKSHDTSLSVASDDKAAVKTSLESTVRKFELRQKISRSPLDNIAMKQTIEENKYLKNEQLKALRKEAKLKSKLFKAATTEAANSVQTSSNAPIDSEMTDSENCADIEDEPEIEVQTKTLSIEEQMKRMKKCSVVLIDFIKKLNINTDDGDTSECETSALEESIDEDNPLASANENTKSDEDSKNKETIKEEAIGTSFKFESTSSENVTSVEHEKSEDSIEVKSDILESGKEGVIEDSRASDVTNSNESKVHRSEYDTKLEDDVFAGQSSENMDVDEGVSEKENVLDSCTGNITNVENKDENVENKLDGNLETITEVKLDQPAEKHDRTKTVGSPKTKSPKKPYSMKPIFKSETQVNQGSVERTKCPTDKVVKPEMSQTARKTVPPLKIKVKGLSSRRKTYMVAPSPDSPVDTDNSSDQKPEKKRKTKSGSKSESDSEKHGKGHHKKGKAFGIKVNGLAGESPSKKTLNTLKMSPAKNNLKPTDAYEANFLQFIQEKNNENNNLDMQVNVKSRNLCPKISKNQHSPARQTEGNASSHSHSPAALADKANKTDSEESVRYVCYMCKDVSYNSNELILKHYKEVHPTVEFMYKQLPDDATESAADADVAGKNGKPDGGASLEVNSGNHDGSVLQDSTGDAGNDDDDDASGSLKLKIVNVVSLKDEMMPEDMSGLEPPFDKPPPPYSASHSTNRQPITTVELRIPGYSGSTSVSLANPIAANIGQEPFNRFLVQLPGLPVFQQLQQQTFQQAVPQKSQHKLIAPAKPASTGGKVTNTFKCEKCNVHAPLLPPLVSHLRNVHKDIPRLFQCPYCKDLEAETESKIIEHIRDKHPTDNPNPPVALSEPAKRNLATVTVVLPDNYKLSENNLLEKDIFLCLICKIYMPSMETISDHLEEKHPEVFLFICPLCKEFKSKTEKNVLVHILHGHRRSAAEVSIPRAIEGNQFTRVQCIVKEKNKRSHTTQQKAQQNTSSNQTLLSPRSTHTLSNAVSMPSSIQAHILGQPILSMSTTPLQSSQLFTAFQTSMAQPKFHNFHPPGVSQPTGIALLQATQSLVNNQPLMTISAAPSRSNASIPPPTVSVSLAIPSSGSRVVSQPVSLGTVSSLASSVSSSLRQALTSTSVVTTAAATKPAVSHPKKKKNLLESINQLKMQKEKEMELQSKQSSVTSSSESPTVSRSSSVPPPLMRAPPPLIRYDHLDKLETSPSSIISSAMRLTSQAPPTSTIAAMGPNGASVTNIPKPIHSSLFDTSDLDGSRPTNRPVLNVPYIPRSAKSPFQHTSSTASPRGAHEHGNENVLDLSKNSPGPSPIQTPSPKPSTSGVPQQDNVNTEMFKVFNLKPNQLVQVTRPTLVSKAPAMPQFSQPMIPPQQVRQNTPNTLAYRQPAPQLIATSQVPQIISMPIPMPLIGNMVFSLPQGSPNMPRFIQMSAPSLPASGFMAATQPLTITNSQSQPAFATSLTSQQLVNLSSLNLSTFKCPYCPRVVPLKFEHVQQHIETKHPGSSIMFLPLENQPARTNPVVLAPAKDCG